MLDTQDERKINLPKNSTVLKALIASMNNGRPFIQYGTSWLVVDAVDRGNELTITLKREKKKTVVT